MMMTMEEESKIQHPPGHHQQEIKIDTRMTFLMPEDCRARQRKNRRIMLHTKAEDTTNTVNNCLRIAENIREDATRKLDTLHQQGQQIERTHQVAVEIDKDLNRGEKPLNSLGGMSSKPWKPK
ncbi:hypothetical protein DITRI_Ditri17bG0117600 [Diplodiscus trichospermus]